MLILNDLFTDYVGYKEMFGKVTHSNGAVSHRNKIMLAMLTDRRCMQYLLNVLGKSETDIPYVKQLLASKDATSFKQSLLRAICRTSRLSGMKYCLEFGDYLFYASDYYFDDLNGHCEDGDERCIRYHRNDNGKVYKMKAGKMFKHCLLNSKLGEVLPEQVIVWLCEELTSDWIASNLDDSYKLHIDNNFGKIYDSFYLKGDFHSCMVDENVHTFYNDAVKAKAAYLTNNDGDVVARAVIFTDVYDEDGNTYRLCERQYSTNEDERLKRLLVLKLIAGGHIDGYKQIGMGCHDNTAFVLNNGKSISDVHLHIECNLGIEDPLSYQDSFIYYDIDKHIAYNYVNYDCDYRLDTTDGRIDGNYDDYHDYYTTNDLTTVYVNGRQYECDSENLDDFVYIERYDEYHHIDDCAYIDGCYERFELREDCVECDECDEWVYKDDAYYSDLTEEYYCCEDCLNDAEQRYKERYFVQCPNCGEYVDPDEAYHSYLTGDDYCCQDCRDENEDEILECWECDSETISLNKLQITLNTLKEHNEPQCLIDRIQKIIDDRNNEDNE